MTSIRRELVFLWVLRSRRGPDVTISGSTMEGLGIDILSRWQKEFQNEFCAACVHFDMDKGHFERKGHQNDPEDCFSHWTDIVGVCWNFKERSTGKNMSDMAQELTEPFPTLDDIISARTSETQQT